MTAIVHIYRGDPPPQTKFRPPFESKKRIRKGAKRAASTEHSSRSRGQVHYWPVGRWAGGAVDRVQDRAAR